ncbi:uncharacterized protein LOC108736243 [Agrilus planipennis]|uniref:Uncharacterized protein LOC108736243 n=1 Tax=Agrilus planipennis TaxID=224129 RepID=A0A1W4WVL8_AGRPL|nr:uncharacterized protein LOC108736243 [Agrilus planipennis]
MTDDRSHATRSKGRSASICATSSTSMDALHSLAAAKGASATSTDHGTSSGRPRRPAARSQSAKLVSGRSIKRKTVQASGSAYAEVGKSHCNSEPKLAHDQARVTPDVSPNIRRKGSTRRGTSVYQRKSTTLLDVPVESRSSSANNIERREGEDEDSYRLRSFSFTSKGIVNRGDSFRRRKSRSNSVCPPNGGPVPNEKQQPTTTNEVSKYVVALIGAQGVGKTSLISQFMTSECINAYDSSKDALGQQTVSIMLNGEESDLVFQNVANPREIDRAHPPDAFVVVYSVVDKASFLKAEAEMTRLQDADLLRSRPAILVANKIDLARSRAVSTQDGKCLACTYRAKFIEVSVGINHNVDELLVGILTQIRLKSFHVEDKDHGQQWYKSRGVVRASMKARQMFTWIFGKEDSKFKNCENLHIL